MHAHSEQPLTTDIKLGPFSADFLKLEYHPKPERNILQSKGNEFREILLLQNTLENLTVRVNFQIQFDIKSYHHIPSTKLHVHFIYQQVTSSSKVYYIISSMTASALNCIIFPILVSQNQWYSLEHLNRNLFI